MSYYAVLLPLVDQEKSNLVRPAHLEFLDGMKQAGHVSAFGRFTDGSGGLVIFNAETYEDCEALVQKDPYVESGARNYEIHEWGLLWADLKSDS
ncbi:hypothetical protein FQV26_13290 [Planococcus sp. CPCC 101016]|uniref:YciI family protein n=1 Tax=Planococcus sp. CPCC 101016 TaxID=2599617 RepID=UPI0011B5E845|nr:YciI family protein [Planococcus sp. CPCC 101016]TWT05406.1 hypothetical protein FQV26_13290 [Planococcus sp. CPCC 101016]